MLEKHVHICSDQFPPISDMSYQKCVSIKSLTTACAKVKTNTR